MTDRCITCRFMAYSNIGKDECRRHAPIQVTVQAEVQLTEKFWQRVDRQQAGWPTVNAYHDWCGDYERKESQSAEASRPQTSG